MLAPNRNIRAPEERLDARTANVLANKERELMQSANQIEYFADGLGTRAPLNSDDLAEKVARFVSTSQVVQDKMVCFFIIKHTVMFNFYLYREYIYVFRSLILNVAMEYRRLQR